jgi:hypothetical protein
MTVVEKQAENAKNKQIKKATGFTKSQPTGFDTDSILGDGDIVVMPTTMPEVFQQVFGKDENGDDIYGEFIVVDVENPSKATRAINFFPSCMTKNIWESEMEDGEVELVDNGGPLNPKGTAVELYTSFQGKTGNNGETDVQLGVEALLGKRINVKLDRKVKVQVYKDGKRVNRLKDTQLLNYNL